MEGRLDDLARYFKHLNFHQAQGLEATTKLTINFYDIVLVFLNFS